jgi:hypothetical protein
MCKSDSKIFKKKGQRPIQPQLRLNAQGRLVVEIVRTRTQRHLPDGPSRSDSQTRYINNFVKFVFNRIFFIHFFLFRCRDRLVPLARMGLHPQTGHDDDPTATLWQRAVDQQSSRQTYSGGIIVARPTEIYLI